MKHILLNLAASVMMVLVAMVNLFVVVHLFRRGFHKR